MLTPAVARLAARTARTLGADPQLWADSEGSPATGPSAGLAPELRKVTRQEVISRALEWVDAGLLYCQAPNGGTDSRGVCEREVNPIWDPYRSDCSGIVSWAWKLPPPGEITATLAPFNNAVSYQIRPDELLPGDALNKKGHCFIFHGFTFSGNMKVIEEFDFRQPAAVHEFEYTVEGDTIVRNGTPFFPIRYRGIEEDSDDNSGVIVAGAAALALTALLVARLVTR